MTTGYRDISDEVRKKAKVFFDRGKTVAETGQFDFAIAMYLEGLNIDPDAVEAHQALLEISLMRKAAGGKALGFMDRMKLGKNKDDKQSMLNAEKLLAHDPGNTDSMVTMLQSALRAGYYATVRWLGPVLMRANMQSKSPDVHKYVLLKDAYKEIQDFKLAVEACQAAMRVKNNDMDLQSELKNLTAQATMNEARYDKDFTQSIKDADGQKKLADTEKDVVGTDFHIRAINEAEAEFNREPNDPAKLDKFLDALLRTEDMERENLAIDLLEKAYKRTGQFKYRMRTGKVKMKQMARMERSMRAEVEKAPKDEQLHKDYEQFRAEQVELELHEYQLAAEQYPTDLDLKFEVAERLFALRRYDESIPLYQQSRNDPKRKIDASTGLARAFLEAGFVDESIETMQGVIDDYQIKGDDRSKLAYYWQGRALEAKGDTESAVKRFSQVAQWEFTYKDVQQRIKQLRARK